MRSDPFDCDREAIALPLIIFAAFFQNSDAEAIPEAVERPKMRFVPIKSDD
jgi:hypothetical protein